MKIVITVLCSLLASVAAQAQLAGSTPAQSSHTSILSPIRLHETGEPMQIKARYIPGQRGIRTGRALTIIGGVLLTGGIVLVSTADELYYNSTTTNGQTTESGDIKGGLGVVMIAGGLGMVIPGIIVWTKSKKKYNRYLMEHPQQSLRINVGGGATGLSYRF